MDKKNLLIACNNSVDAEGLAGTFSHLEKIRLLPGVLDGEKAIETILARDVDLLLLDLFLPGKDGLDVLSFLSSVSEDRRPLVFVMTALPDDRLLYRIKDQILYCFTKPLQFEIVQLRVLEILRTMELEERRTSPNMDILEAQIAAGIRAIGIPAHLKGYYYLRDAIRMYALANSPTDISITKDIYPAVAKLYNTRSPLVEHAIRTAIETAWIRGNLDTIHAYFGYTINDCKGKPSNLEFIAMMADRALTYVKK